MSDDKQALHWAVITTYNEIATIGSLVEFLGLDGFSVVVVDDCSTDDTVREARHYGAIVLTSEQRTGIGPCLMRGWRYALEHGAETVIQLDAGGSHHPADAVYLHQCLIVNGADMVIGDRFDCRIGGQYDNDCGRWWRPVASRAMAVACNLATGANISDWTSGMRAFSAPALRYLLSFNYISAMHAWQIEVLARAYACNMHLRAVGITYRAGRSSFGWRQADEAINAWLQVFFHIGGRHASGCNQYSAERYRVSGQVSSPDSGSAPGAQAT